GGRRELALALAAADLLDADLDRVAEPVTPPAAAADERRAERVQLEIVAGEPTRRDEAFEHVAEAREQARRDQPDDLSLEHRLPAEVEQPPLEQPREADRVGAVPELRSLALAHRRMLGQLRKILR